MKKKAGPGARYLLLLFTVFMLSACSPRKREPGNTIPAQRATDSNALILQKIMGKWSIPGSREVFLEVGNLDVRYPAAPPIPYEIRNSQLVFHNPDGSTETSFVRFSGDSLILTTTVDGEPEIYIRWH